MSDFDSRYLTVPQVASDLRLDVSAVYKLCKANELPSVRFGKSVRIPRLAYERYLQRLEGTAQSDSSTGRSPRPVGQRSSPSSRRPPGRIRRPGSRHALGQISDTSQNTRQAIRALALRGAMTGRGEAAASR